MSLEAILERIRAAGEVQVKEIRSQSEGEVQAILADAQAEAEQVYQAAFNQALEPEASERARILNQARFEAVCLSGKARESLVNAALEQVSSQMEDIRGDPKYPAAFRKILMEMLPGQNSSHKMEDRLILQADPRDRELLESLLKEEGLKIRVEYNLHCWGGMIARSTDEKTRVVNTLESRLERVLPYLKQQLMPWFGQDQSGPVENQPAAKAGNPVRG